MLIALIVLAGFLVGLFWPVVLKSRADLGAGPVISAPLTDVARFDCVLAEIFIDRHHVERPSFTITVEQRPPDRPIV